MIYNKYIAEEINKIIDQLAPIESLKAEIMQVGLEPWLYRNIAEIDLFIEEVNEKYGSIQELEKVAYQSESDDEYILLIRVEAAIESKKEFLNILKSLKELEHKGAASAYISEIKNSVTIIG
ncbi:MAG: hypothetical protein ACE5KE_15390 [Methanosarcinales archaeon]